MTDAIPPTSENHAPFPTVGRLAAIDFGTVRIGIALCDPDRILVSPWEVHTRGKAEGEAKYFQRLAKEERVAGFIVGLPIHCDGGESQKSGEAREFARWLHELTGVPVRMFDERFSTAQARRRLRSGHWTHKDRKARIDAIAAQILLEAFLEVSQYTGKVPGQVIDAQDAENDPLD